MGVRYTNATMSSAQRTSKYIVKGGEIDIDGELDPPPPSLFPLTGGKEPASRSRRCAAPTRCGAPSTLPGARAEAVSPGASCWAPRMEAGGLRTSAAGTHS